jgi:hypothetical protein
MSTAPSGAPGGNPPVVSELDRVKNDLARARADLQVIRAELHGSWLFHDMIVYGGMYLTLWLSSVPAGAGWDVLIAAAPAAGMSLLRRAIGNQPA